jgi:opacity protein-like surface antigen
VSAPRQRPRRAFPRLGGSRRWVAVIVVAVLGVAALGPAAEAKGHRFRPYVAMRLGTMFYTNGDAVPGAVVETPAFNATGSRIPTWGVTVGADLSRFWGFEFTYDYAKTEMSSQTVGSLGDYHTKSLAGQLRLRVPVDDGRLVPYAIAGGGYGTGGYLPGKNFTYPICCRGSAAFGVLGGGLEYFIGPNVAVGVESKYQYLFHPDVTLNGRRQRLTADSVALTADLRLYLDRMASGADVPANPPPAADSGMFSGYLAVRGGDAVFTNPDGAPAVTIDDWSSPLLSASLGANFDRHVGAELAFEYGRAQLRSPTLGKITGYPFWTTLGLLRFREPMLRDRLSPYVVVGGGLGFAQTGDPNVPLSQSGFGSKHNVGTVAAAGLGFDYFLEHNIALNVETRDTFLFDADVSLNGRPMKLDASFVSFTGGLRIFFR